MTLLILGGTADARELAGRLAQECDPAAMIYSVAGLVRRPQVDCEIISGGFRQFGGLAAYIHQRNITAVMDVTHPYASIMTQTAASVCRDMGLAYWRFQRPAWQPTAQDQWVSVENWSSLVDQLAGYQSVFFSAGQLPHEVMDCLAVLHEGGKQRQLLRTAAVPVNSLPKGMSWIKAIGPFELAQELALMCEHRIDVVVSKNSGGDSTVAKLEAARQLSLPVFMLKRPAPPENINFFDDLQACVDTVQHTLNNL